MRADIEITESESVLRLTPVTRTEESLLRIWLADNSQNVRQIKDIVLAEAYDDDELISAAVIKKAPEGIEQTTTKEQDKKERADIHAQLAVLDVTYNKKARLPALRKVLAEAKIAAGGGKPPGKVEPPTAPAAPPAPPAPPEPPTEAVTTPATVDAVREALKKFAAVKGREKAKKLLADHDAVNVSTLKVESYAAFLIAAVVTEAELQAVPKV